MPELAIINSTAKNVLVITEGVTLYMTTSQVNDLAADLRAQTNFVYWINDYVSPRVLKALGRRRMREKKRSASVCAARLVRIFRQSGVEGSANKIPGR